METLVLCSIVELRGDNRGPSIVRRVVGGGGGGMGFSQTVILLQN